jgi:hypothetical protein
MLKMEAEGSPQNFGTVVPKNTAPYSKRLQPSVNIFLHSCQNSHKAQISTAMEKMALVNPLCAGTGSYQFNTAHM